MLINNIDISSLDIQLYDRVITSNDITTHEEWLDGDIQPTFIRQQDGFKTINLTFLIIHFNSVRISSNKETVWKPVTYVYCLVILFSKTCSLLFFIFLTYHIIQLVLFRKM